ncbi:MAG TPA: hypothetical protein VLA24_05660 [Pseudomonadales bacterium]|nr:hypothetical protein [Pseudomonadales bacterium]
MSDEADNQDSQSAQTKPQPHPLAKGYWSHLATAVILVIINLGFMVGLLSSTYSVYQEANAVSDVTPAKRLDAVEAMAQGGRAELIRSITSLGIDKHFSNISQSFTTHRRFYERLLRSDEDFSKLMHLQQNGVTHFAGIIGQSDAWQQRYTQGLMSLPVNSARRQFVIRQTMDALQELPRLSD